MKAISVTLVEDHPVVRSGIRSFLEKVSDIEIVGEATTGKEALVLLAEKQPDVLLLDLELPDMRGVDVARQVHQDYTDVKILALSAHQDSVYIQSLMELGAAGYLVKEEAPEVILEAVRGVANGEKGWVSRSVAAQISDWIQAGATDEKQLTLREKEVLQRVVDGKTNQAIAVELGISEKTIEKYMGEIFKKLNVTSRVEAAVYAVREGLL